MVGDVMVVQPMPAPLRRAIKAVLDSASQEPEADLVERLPLGASPVSAAGGASADPVGGDIEAHARASILGQEMLNAEQIADLTLIFSRWLGELGVVTRKCPSCKGRS